MDAETPDTGQVSYDIVVVGGGMVGASLVRALTGKGFRIAVIEAVPLVAETQPSFNERTLALSYSSQRIFEAIGVWAGIEALGATPIRHIHVSDRGHAGVTRIEGRDEGVDALGYVVPSRVLGTALASALEKLPDVDVYCPGRLEGFEVGDDEVRITLGGEAGGHMLRARLVIGADGAASAVREQAGIRSLDVDYAQTAVIANVRAERFHDYVAYERFTSTGPLAVLPAGVEGSADERRCAVVWTVRNDQTGQLLEMNDASFLAGLQERFGRRLGRFEAAGERSAWPLSLRQAREHVRPRLALIGNAAHTLHPVAGQGFNLGLRDVATLAQVLVDARRRGEDPGAMTVLRRYADWRRRDHWRVIAFTDSLVRIFSNRVLPVVAARNLGLLAADVLPGVKHRLARQAMGLSGRLPRLARGLAL